MISQPKARSTRSLTENCSSLLISSPVSGSFSKDLTSLKNFAIDSRRVTESMVKLILSLSLQTIFFFLQIEVMLVALNRGSGLGSSTY